MKKTNFIRLLVLMMVLITSIKTAWADGRTFDGTEKLYIKNAKPYYRENGQDKTWDNTWIQNSSQYMHVAFRATSNGAVTWATATYYKGGSNAYEENAIYEVTVPSGTWTYLLITRKGDATQDWGWNTTGEITISTTQNMITHFKISDGYAAWAYVPMTVSANDPVYVYFDNSNANWDNKIQFVIGHSTYGRAYPLVKLDGTKLAYKNLEDVYDGAWSDATYYAVAQKSTDLTSSDGASNYDYSSVTSNATKYTAAYRNRNAMDLTANNTFLCTTSSGNNGTAWNITYKSGGYSDLNNTQTIYKSLNNSTSSADVGTVSITTTKLTNNVTASENNSTNTIGTSASSATADAVITATVSLSVSAKDGYVFDGWATSANGDVIDGSNTSPWTYTANSTNARYAKFHYNSYTVTLDPDNGNSTESVSAMYNTAMPSTKLPSGTLTAPTWSNYTFEGYFDDHAGSGTKYYTNTVGSAHVWDKTSATTLYAKWTSSITLDANGGSLDGSVTVTYKGGAGTPSAPTYTGKVLLGYYAAADGDNLIMDKDGTLHANKDGYTDASGNWIGAGDAKLYAHWTDHTWALYRNSGATKLGDLTPRGSDVYTINLNIVSGTNNDNWSLKLDGETMYEFPSTSPIGSAQTLSTGSTYRNWSGGSYGNYTLKIYYESSAWKLIANASPQISFTASPTGGTMSASAEIEGTISSGAYVTYGSDVTFTSTPSTGYTLEGIYTNSGCTEGKTTTNPLTVSVTAATGRYAKFSETMHTITITGGSAASTTAGIVTTGSATANDPATGKKFTGWELGDGITLSGCSVTDQTISFTATKAATVTATYNDRAGVKLYFASPGGWDKIYAYAWKEEGSANGDFPGVEITENTEVVNCATYYVYQYYTEADGIGHAATGSDTWDNVIFGNGTNPGIEYPTSGWTQTHTLDIASGNFYRAYETANSTGRSTGNEWYVKGNFENAGWTDFSYPIDLNCATSAGYVDIDMSDSYTHYFQILQASTNKTYRISTANADAEVSIGTEYTLYEKSNNADKLTNPTTTTYRFTLDVSTPSAPTLTVRPANDENHTVTFAVSGHGSITTPGTGTQTIHEYEATTITAVPEPGYRFVNWTVAGTNSSNIHIASTTSSTTTVTADADVSAATITANFTNDQFIYLKKDAISGSWGGDVYVYFYSKEYWDKDGKGTGSKNGDGMTVRGPFKMNKLNDKDQIYYYDYSGMENVGTYKTTQYVAFADHSMSEYGNFSACQAIYRGDFYPDANMFVVEDYKTYYNTKASAGQAVYYNGGYWMKFNDSDPGYVLKVYNLKTGGSLLYSSRFSGTAGSYTFTTTKRFTGANLYFELLGCDTLTKNGIGYRGTYYNNTGTMTSSNAPYGWTFYHNVGRCGLKASATGDYTFTLSCTDGHLSVKVDFPVAIGDMRVLYSGKVSTTGSAKAHPSRFIRLLGKPTIASDSTQTDTISFFIINGSSPTIRYQRCDNFDGSGNPIWKDTIGSTYDISSFETGIYTFVITQTSYKGATANSTTCASKGLYSGDFYIRTDEAGGGWQGYAASPNSKMIQSDIALAHGGYDYYHCHWIKKSHNAQFTIANRYSECISDTLKDDAYTSGDGNLPDSASVRFMWNSSTNVIGRAYLSGSNDGEAEFLKIQSDPSKTDTNPEGDGVTLASLAGIIKSDGTRYTNNTATFSDLNNWVYQLDVKVKEGARIKLTSNYRYNSTDHIQYFKGLSWKEGDAGTAWDDNHTAPILGGSEKKYQSLRIVYDFKTNHLLSAWLADGDPITGNAPVAINTDVIILREGQDDARQITFSGTGSLTEVDTVYGVISFNKWTLNNKNTTEPHAALDPAKSVYERDLYWISFPFDVKLNDVFGFGTYGTHWIVEYYDGKGRAKNGFWADSPSNWKFLRKDTILHANEGYILALDLDMLGESSKVWDNSVEDVYLYFPSKESVGNIQATSVDVTFANQNAYKCTINRGTAQGDRRIKDSYWHCIGVPSYANGTNEISDSATPTPSPESSSQDNWNADIPFLYIWDSEYNTLSVSTSSTTGTFKAMRSYLIQFSGLQLSWTDVTNAEPAGVAARLAETPDREYNLQLMLDNEEQDHTYVRLTDDASVSNRFEFNYDLSKEYNGGRGNIWTVTADTVEVAGNSMPKPVQTTVVPVGVKVVANGEYTFSMPEGTNGENVVLIDNAYGTRTNLGLMPYTVTLTAGTYEFGPIQDAPTGIEQMSTVNYQLSTEEVRKVFVGGRLYIIRDGKVYDAAGQRVE